MLFSLVFIATLQCIATVVCLYPSQQVFHGQTTPLGIPWQGPPMKVSRSLYDTHQIPFEEHNTGLLWVGMQLDYTHVTPLLAELNSTGEPLLSRKEAHITLIDPVEYIALATANITIDDLNRLARRNNIQSSEFNMVCIGKAKKNDNTVYQIIVSSPALIQLREKVFKLFYSKQGNPSLFDPHAYWPHVTIGFTDHDIFLNEGVYKGVNACFRPISVV